MTSQPTPEQLLQCAQIVESEHEWGFHESFVASDVPYCAKTYTFYAPIDKCERSIRQQLRIRKHLAKRGIVVVKDSDGITRAYTLVGVQLGMMLSANQDDDICAVLAVIALGDG